jgi:hypothetical protein
MSQNIFLEYMSQLNIEKNVKIVFGNTEHFNIGYAMKNWTFFISVMKTNDAYSRINRKIKKKHYHFLIVFFFILSQKFNIAPKRLKSILR